MATDTQHADKTHEQEHRLPTLKHINETQPERTIGSYEVSINPKIYRMRGGVIAYNFAYRGDLLRRHSFKRDCGIYNYCLLSVLVSFILGLVIGITIVGSPQSRAIMRNFAHRKFIKTNSTNDGPTRSLNSLKSDGTMSNDALERNEINAPYENSNGYVPLSFTGVQDVHIHKHKMDIYPKGLTDDMKEILKDNKDVYHRHTISNINTTTHVPNSQTVLYRNIFWGPEVENSMPQGYGENSAEVWEKYIEQSEIVKMENGCGRMQNRLITFKDGVQACVRYRQNTDQIQGEIFSFYLGRLLNLTNLAPSVVKVVDTKDTLWKSVANDIAAAQWNTNRAVVLTQYIPSLESANIPDIFKPSNRHLNKNDVLSISLKENGTIDNSKQILIDKIKMKNIKSKHETYEYFDHIDVKLNKKTINSFVELAQWSDLIIFDYLTANLDRIVNNLFNYQWNVNIMDGPAHNLARKMDSGLLVFLDNESGLLHGYRLLKKYNVYHSLMLDNLCVFRKKTVDALRELHDAPVGGRISELFHKKNDAVIRDILPPLPEKNAKILHERIGKVLNQIEMCEHKFSDR